MKLLRGFYLSEQDTTHPIFVNESKKVLVDKRRETTLTLLLDDYMT